MCKYVSVHSMLDTTPGPSIRFSLHILNYNLRYEQKKKKKVKTNSSLPAACPICHVLVEGVVGPYYGVIHTCFSRDTEFL